MSNYKKDLVTLDYLVYHYSTLKCFVVSIEEDTFAVEAERIFLPKSLVEKYEEPSGISFEMPEWLAEEKGLL